MQTPFAVGWRRVGATISVQLAALVASGGCQNVEALGTAAAADTPPGLSEAAVAEQMTREHLQARRSVVSAEQLPPLSWSATLAAEAREWAAELARRCQGLEHRTLATYGQNLASRASMGTEGLFSPAEAVAGWMAEGQCYTHGKFATTDRCDKACVAKLGSTGCGHYTQVVWRTTRELGCSYSSCKRDGFLVEYWVCNYSPPGNVRGREPY